MSPQCDCITASTSAILVASTIVQKYPRGRTRAIQRRTHLVISALWCALCRAGVPRKYGGFVITRSNVRALCHVVMSVLINSMGVLFNLAFRSHSASISGDISRPVNCMPEQFAAIHNDTAPVPTPTSSAVFIPCGANAANHTASDVGLYRPRRICTRPPIRVKIACFSVMSIYNNSSK